MKIKGKLELSLDNGNTFFISDSTTENRVDLYYLGGEGGEFNLEDFIKTIQKFYSDNF